MKTTVKTALNEAKEALSYCNDAIYAAPEVSINNIQIMDKVNIDDFQNDIILSKLANILFNIGKFNQSKIDISEYLKRQAKIESELQSYIDILKSVK